MRPVVLMLVISLASVALARFKREGQCPALNSMRKIPKEKYMFPDMDRSDSTLVKMTTCKSHAYAADVDLNMILTHACTGKVLSKNCTAVTKDGVSPEEVIPTCSPSFLDNIWPSKPGEQLRNFCHFNWTMGTYKPWQSVDIMKQIAGPGGSGWSLGYVNLAPGVWQTLESWDLRVAVKSQFEIDEIIIRGIDVLQFYNAYIFPPFWMDAEDPRSSNTTGVFIKHGIVGATNGHGFVLGPGSAIIVQGSPDSKCGVPNWERNRNVTSFLVANGTVRLGANSKLMVAGPHTSLVLTSTNDSDIVIPPNVSICVCNGDEEHTSKYGAHGHKNGGHGSVLLHDDAIKDLTPGWNYLFNLPNVAAYGPKGSSHGSWIDRSTGDWNHPFNIIEGRFKPKPGDKDPFVDPSHIKVDVGLVFPTNDYSLFVRYTGENPPAGFANCCMDLFRGTSVTTKKKKAGVRNIMDAAWKNSKITFDYTSCPAYRSPLPPILSSDIPQEVTTGPGSPITTQPTATTITQKPSLPAWVIPVSATLGGLLLVGGSIIAVVCWKRYKSATGISNALPMKSGKKTVSVVKARFRENAARPVRASVRRSVASKVDTHR